MKKFMAMLLALVMALSLMPAARRLTTPTRMMPTPITPMILWWFWRTWWIGRDKALPCPGAEGRPKGFLLPGINKAIAELTANDGALIKEIENKVASQDTYTPDSVSSDLAAADKDAAASDKPVLVMGTSPDYPPYEFFADAAMTEYAGIDVEVAKYIAESMGMTLQIESMNFDNLVTS